MKKLILFFLAVIFFAPILACCEANESWDTAPIITQAYEISSGKLYLEWIGNASVYQVYVDGKSVESVIVNNAVISVSKGTHTISVYPIDEIKEADSKIDIGLRSDKIEVLKLDLGFDLAMIGLDPKKLVAGNPSKALVIDYSPNTILDAKPDNLNATTDPQDRVLLSFSDRYYADEYIVSIKTGKDINYIKFTKEDKACKNLIQRDKGTVTLTLDPAFLEKQECMIPELDNKYSFTVQLRKYAENMTNGEKVSTVIHQSKESSSYSYTPTAAWKTAPVINYASQTADGQVTFYWEHQSYGVDCEYSIVELDKTFGFTTDEEEIGTTKKYSFVINDLMNGDHTFAIYPVFNNERGNISNEAEVNIQNEWVAAPIVSCDEVDKNTVRLTWTSAEGVDKYHITVYKGDSNSWLRFVNLDYDKYDEFTLPAEPGKMEHFIILDDQADTEDGIKLKFEIYGIRLTEQNKEQKTATTTETITIGTK